VAKVSPKLNLKKRGIRQDADIGGALFKSIGIATIIVDEDAKILLANREYEKLSGYSKEELEGKKKWTDFLANSDPSKIKEYEDFIENEEKRTPKNHEFKFFDRKGRTKDVIATKNAIAGTKKTVISFINITEMMEGKERTEISEEKYRSLIESTDDSIYMIDRDCRYQFVNGRVPARLKVTEKRIIGKRYSDFHDTNDTREFENYVSKIFKTGISCQYEYKSRKEDRYTLRTLSPIMEPNTRKVRYQRTFRTLKRQRKN